MRETRYAYKALQHQVRTRNAIAQGKIAARRIALWQKIAPLIDHKDDKELIQMTLNHKRKSGSLT